MFLTMDDFTVEPLVPDEAPPATETAPQDPLELIIKGDVPAASIQPGSDDPVVQQIADGFLDAAESGSVDFFDTESGVTVLFNPQRISRQKLLEAEQNGQLEEVAPPIETLLSGGPAEPVSSPSGALDIPVAPLTGPKTPAKVQQARKANLVPASPTERVVPGAGVLANGLQKRAI